MLLLRLFIPGWHDGNGRSQCAHLSGPAAVQAPFCSLSQQYDKKKIDLKKNSDLDPVGDICAR